MLVLNGHIRRVQVLLILLSWSVLSGVYCDLSNHIDEANVSSRPRVRQGGLYVPSDLYIRVLATPNICTVKVNGRYVLYVEKKDFHRENRDRDTRHNMMRTGLHTVVISPISGRRTGHVFSPGNIPNGAFFSLQEFIVNVQTGNIIVFCVLGESALSLDDAAMVFFNSSNSLYMPDLQARSPLAMVSVKGGNILAEGYSLNLDSIDFRHPGYSLQLTATTSRSSVSSCFGLQSPEQRMRKEFCSKYDGYRHLCDCEDPRPMKFSTFPFDDGSLFEYPVIILASKRPQYLHRCLASLLGNRGLNISRLLVYIDGDYPEVRQLLELFNISFHEHVVESEHVFPQDVGTKIAVNYKYAIQHAFNRFPDADKIVILEEDLEVSPDFINYFQQTHHLLDLDVSLYCISAWNDHGYNHTVGDPTLLYRIGFLPGLGWMMKKDMFINEILPNWPSNWKSYDWDVRLRLQEHRKGRDCVIPDVSRTYHFGFEGNHVGAGMQFKYYYDHAFNTIPDVKLRDVDEMVYPRYRKLLMNLIREARTLNGSLAAGVPCSSLFPSNVTNWFQNTTHMLFISMFNSDDTKSWQTLSTCLNLWDLDIRGDYRGIWRFWYNSNPIIIIGVPYSDFSALAVNVKGDIYVYSGERTAEESKLGRWPPGFRREQQSDKQHRVRAASQALYMSYQIS